MMANRIGRLEFLFWCVASILAGSIVLATLSAIANISIEPGRTPHLSQGLVFIAVAVVMLKAHCPDSTTSAGPEEQFSSHLFPY
jgi:uncharacterized membrane protein YhaH (DUF805 family)